MSSQHASIRIPESAATEFNQVEEMDWSDGVGLEELLGWINEVAERFRPQRIGEASRSSRQLTSRTFRHYQTLGCIDAPVRVGRRVVYGFRHYVQALLLRRLIWEGVPSDRIATAMAGRSTADTKRLLFDGIEIVAKPRQDAGSGMPGDPSDRATAEPWRRIVVRPGVELHLHADLPKPKPAELSRLISDLESAVRKNFITAKK